MSPRLQTESMLRKTEKPKLPQTEEQIERKVRKSKSLY